MISMLSTKGGVSSPPLLRWDFTSLFSDSTLLLQSLMTVSLPHSDLGNGGAWLENESSLSTEEWSILINWHLWTLFVILMYTSVSYESVSQSVSTLRTPKFQLLVQQSFKILTMINIPKKATPWEPLGAPANRPSWAPLSIIVPFEPRQQMITIYWASATCWMNTIPGCIRCKRGVRKYPCMQKDCNLPKWEKIYTHGQWIHKTVNPFLFLYLYIEIIIIYWSVWSIHYKIGQHLTKCHINKINNKHYTQNSQST